MEPGLRTRLLTVATLALVFASGGITGYAAAARDGEAAEAPPSPRRGYVFEQFERTDAQQVQIDSILRAHRKGMSVLNAELHQVQQRVQEASDSISRATGEGIAQVFPSDVATDYLQRLQERRDEQRREREEAERDPRDAGRR